MSCVEIKHCSNSRIGDLRGNANQKIRYPGFVNTGVIGRFLDTVTGPMAIPATIARWAALPMVNWFSTSVDEAGERGLFLATSARYPPSKPKTDFVGVELPQGVEVANSSVTVDGVGNGVYRLLPVDDSAPDGDVLPGYRLDGVGKTVWEETQAVWVSQILGGLFPVLDVLECSRDTFSILRSTLIKQY